MPVDNVHDQQAMMSSKYKGHI